MEQVTHCVIEGLEKAAVGVYINEYGNAVIVYDNNRALEVFKKGGRNTEQAADYITTAISHMSKEEAPIFVVLDPTIEEDLANQRPTAH